MADNLTLAIQLKLDAEAFKTSSAQAGTAFASVMDKLKDAAKQSGEVVQSALKLDAGPIKTSSDQAGTAFVSVMDKLKAAAKQSGEAVQSAFNRLEIRSDASIKSDIQGIHDAFATLRDSASVSAAEVARAERSMQASLVQLGNELRNVQPVADKTKSSLTEAFGGMGRLLGGLGLVVGVSDMAKGLFDAALQADKLHSAMLVVSGSSKKAGENFAWVDELSQRMGLEINSTAEAFIKLTAASKGTALEGEATRQIFEAVAQAGSALHLSSEEMSGALSAIGQMMSKGSVQAEELRGQLGERLPGAFLIMARSMGISGMQLSKQLDEGKVGIEVLKGFAVELKKTYSDAQFDGLQQNINRLETAWMKFKGSVASGDTFNYFVKNTTEELDSFRALILAVESAWRQLFGGEAGQVEDYAKRLKQAMEPLSNGVREMLQNTATAFAKVQGEAGKTLKALASDGENTAKLLGSAFDARLGMVSRDLDERLRSLQNAGQSERASIEATTQAHVTATNQRVAEIRRYGTEAEAQWSATLATQKALAQQSGDSLTDIEAQSVDQRIALYGKLEEAYQSTVDALIAEENRHVQAAQQAAQARADLALGLEDRIRNLQQKGMGDYQAYKDRQAQIDEKQAAASKALEEGRYELAVKLSQQAGQMAENNAQKVESNKQVLVTQAQATKQAIEEMRQSASVQDAALAAQQKSNEQAAKSLGDAAATANAQLAATQTTLDRLRQEGLKALDLKVTVDTQSAQAEIDKFKAIQATDDQAVKLRTLLESISPEQATGQIKALVDELNTAAKAAGVSVPAQLQTDEAEKSLADLRQLAAEPTRSAHTVEVANLAELKRFFDELQQPTQSTHTINVVQTGGVQAFAHGGEISGPEGGDIIPILASNGEFVMRRSAVRQFGLGFMHAVNAGHLPSLPRYATGGAVGVGASPGAAGGREVVEINFNVGSQTYRAQSAREQAMGLAQALKELSRG